MVSLVSQHSLEGEHRLWVAQATFDWVGWQHVRALAYLLLACCVRTGEGARSSTMPLSCTGAVASSRRVATQPRISQAWVYTPPVGGAGHFLSDLGLRGRPWPRGRVPWVKSDKRIQEHIQRRVCGLTSKQVQHGSALNFYPGV